MGSLAARSDAARFAAAALYVLAVALFVLFQEIGLALRREEQRAWWPGTGRDVLNLTGFAAVAAALVLYGYPVAAAIAAGGTLTLVLFGTSMALETRPWRHRRALALGAGVALGLPFVVLPGAVLAAWTLVFEHLFRALGRS